VVRFRISLAAALAFGAILAGVLYAQVSEHNPSSEMETRATPSPKPKKTPTAVTKSKAGNHKPNTSPKTKRRPTPTPTPKSAKKKTGKKTPGKAAKSKSAQKEEETPKPKKTPLPQVEDDRATPESATPPPRAIVVLTPAPSSQPQAPRAVSSAGQAQVVIEKSGIEEDQGFEPPPSAPPRRFGLWPWSRPVNYRYLTSSVIEAIRRAPV